GREAKARADAGLAALALAVLVAGFGPAGVAADLTRRSALLALPGLFVTVEAAAVLARRDEFWARIVAGAAVLAEVPAAVIGWPLAPAVVAAVAVGTASGPVTAGTVVVLGAVLATASGRGARLAAGALALWAPISTVQRPWAALAAGVAGAAVATVAARRA